MALRSEDNCRVCGFPIEEQSQEQLGGHPICDCCGVEAGIEDQTLEDVVEYRDVWLQRGVPWFSPDTRPDDWDLDAQLAQIPSRYGFSPIIEQVEVVRRLHEDGEVELVLRARIPSEVWVRLLEEDFETYAPVAAQATVLRGKAREMLFEAEDQDVLKILGRRDDLTGEELERTTEFRECSSDDS